MAKGNEIVVTTPPRGVHIEGFMKTGQTCYPGTCLEIDASVDPIGGRFTFKLADPDADGGRPKGPLIIANIDFLQGKTASSVYAADSRVFGWIPGLGEEINVLLADVTGTGDDHLFGEMLIVDKGTGLFIATTGSPETEPFMLLEDFTDPTSTNLAWAIYTGY